MNMALKGTLTVPCSQTQQNKTETTNVEAPQSAAQTEDLCLSRKQVCAALKAILPDVIRNLDTSKVRG